MSKSDALEKLFHQPTRLDLMSELCSSEKEKTFAEVKEACGLTDGNLSRHLQSLEKGGVIKIKKRFVDSKPQTTVMVTKKGRERFIAYLSALEDVLRESAKRAGVKSKGAAIIPGKVVIS
jgi:DNA-binding MarR family transcriptional regulator